MIHYSNIEAQRILGRVAAVLDRKLYELDVFCKVIPNVGEPYFIPNKYFAEVGAAVEALGIVGQHSVSPEEITPEPSKERFGRFSMEKHTEIGNKQLKGATPQ